MSDFNKSTHYITCFLLDILQYFILTLGDVLLTPTKIYVKPVLSLLKLTKVKAIAHITGGGLPGNVTRVLPDGVCVELDANSWQIPPVFSWIAKEVNTTDLFQYTNVGGNSSCIL